MKWQFTTLFQFVLLLLFSPVLTGETEWQNLKSPPFEIFYLPEDQVYAKRLPLLLQNANQQLSNALGLQLEQEVRVFLAPSEHHFNQLTGNLVPHWGEGVADPSNYVIILKSPGLTENEDRFPKLIRHELTHILVGQAVRRSQAVPKWFNEGIALYLSYDEEFAGGEAISKALLSDSIIPLDEIDAVLQFQQAKARLAYEESYSFILFLEEQFGHRYLVALVRELDQGATFNRAFAEVFGIDLFEAELQWYEALEEKYRWRFLMDFETMLWIFILILFIFVFLAIRLRNRRTLKKWAEEERLIG